MLKNIKQFINSSESLQETVVRKERLETESKDSQKKLNALAEAIQAAKAEKTLFFMNADSRYQESEEGQAKASELGAKAAALQAQYEEEQARRDDLIVELESLVIVVDNKDLARQYQQIDTTNDRINALTAAIEKIRQNDNGAALVDTVTALKDERQAALADVAMGIDREKDIDHLDTAIAQAEASDSAANDATMTAAKRTAETIAGLEARLQIEQNDLKKLEHLAMVMRHELLVSMAQNAAAEYGELAQQLLAKLLNIMAIDHLIANEYGIKPGVDSKEFQGAQWTLTLPKTAKLEQINNLGGNGLQFVNTERWRINIDQQIKELKQALKAAGVRL